MQLKKLTTVVTIAGLLAAGPALAVDPPNFDFNGYAVVPANIGGTLTLRSILTNNGVVPTPIALDFANNQYTLVVTALRAADSGIATNWTGGALALYEDPIGGGTAADYGTPGTFVDGTQILSGQFDGLLVRNVFTPSLGNFTGSVDFTGGTRLGDLPTPQDWPFGGGWSRSVSGIPAGYQENWDGLIELAPVGVESKTWNGLKQLYRP